MSRLDLPPVWGAAALAAIWAWARAVDLLPAPGWALWPGLLLIAAGAGYVLWAAPLFRRRGTPIMPRQTPSALIVEGPYRHTRNPIYRGFALIAAGWAVASGELTGLAIAAAYAAVLVRRFVLPEEATLRATFGAAFEAWAARTPRL